MAIYHLTVRIGRRSATGALSSAAAKADYVLRQGKYRRGADEVAFSDAGNMPSWASPPRPLPWSDPDIRAAQEMDRHGRGGVTAETAAAVSGLASRRAAAAATYWGAADLHERANGRLFRELEFSLPRELPADRSAALAKRFAERLCDGERLPWTLAVHRGGGDNPHAHLVISERANDGIDRTAETWFRRADRGDPAAGGALKSRSLQTKAWLREVRAAWAEHTNRELSACGFADRIDHRSLALQREAALAVGDVALAEELDRAPIHQSRSSLALESEAPDGGPGQVPRPAWNGSRRRGRRRRPGETPTSARASSARGINARLAESLAAVRMSEARLRGAERIAGHEARLASAASRLTAQGTRDREPPFGRCGAEEPATLKGRLEWEQVGLDGFGPRLDECGDDILQRVEDEGERLETIGDRLMAAGRRLFARIEDSPDLQRDLAEWAKSRGMTLWGRDPDEILRLAADPTEERLEDLRLKQLEEFELWCDWTCEDIARGEGQWRFTVDMPAAAKAMVWRDGEADERADREHRWRALAAEILGEADPHSERLKEACRLPRRGGRFRTEPTDDHGLADDVLDVPDRSSDFGPEF